MRSFTALTIILALTACTRSNEREGASGTINEGNRAGTGDVNEVPPPGEPANTPPKEAANACSVQDGAALKIASIKGLGTEPFWNVRTEGRCVTYSTPEDQAGSRIWTKAAAGAGETSWTGALRGKPFVLSVKPKTDCSDGMSDKTYPMEAELRVDGEVRHGCAEPL